MRAKRTHVVITESNKSEQPDSNHDKLFIDVSKQSDELFQYQGNTSSDDQYKNQQLDTETVSQQGLYSVPSADMILGPIPTENSVTSTPFFFASRKCPNS